MRRRKEKDNYEQKDPCLTMHQPWASLLVHGIKRVEGRSWPSPIRGRLWIHAASKVPDAATIRAMEDFYREIYAVDGVTHLKFPEHYPVRLEALTNFCWLCEHPKKLLDPLKMRGDQGVYDLERKMCEAAVVNLVPVEIPYLVKFPLPNSGDCHSLRPGSLHPDEYDTKDLGFEKTSTLMAAIAGAQAAAMQYTHRNQSSPKDTLLKKDMIQTEIPNKLKSLSLVENRRTTEGLTIDKAKRKSKFVYVEKQKQPGSISSDRLDKRPGEPSQVSGFFSDVLDMLRTKVFAKTQKKIPLLSDIAQVGL
ncbi:hypothetical protein KSS87_000931 [Heliosperma pusillum]|nr:hypothetical protein KSS87_015918 [Heliosperma pusillum]KAH9616302.1 hypothetical protein KSS87_000931 [Heliosperma pusillum]